uniref:Uncharacterized protein n=1 Tax=Macrostomum lignano TaxID=282301 RepID=A0A1I8GSZ9_9PLAT
MPQMTNRFSRAADSPKESQLGYCGTKEAHQTKLMSRKPT